ncbi:MAG: hypothetical protein J6S67_03495 [Methanobrevibacter sp.]|nr:hypothetical protein [Methanobrevibacter sp.]
MATRPSYNQLTASSVDILNAIRNSATANYRDYVPSAEASTDSIRAIGAVIMQYPALQNEFLSALVNRIGRVLITNKMFSNPWQMFKKGMLEFGETIEEIFVNIAKPYEYDVAEAETKVFKREIPDVRAAFHIMNYQKFYKATIQENDLRQAFLGWNGITDLIAKIVDSMYTGANYDEFLTMKYLLARHILNGELYPVQVASVSSANMRPIVSTIKGVSNNFEFPNTKYNLAGVTTFSTKERQYIITNADFDAAMDVEVLATAFNMNKAEFMGHRVMIDSFGNLDKARLAYLFADDDAYVELSDAELAALDAIPAVLVDEDWFMIFDKLVNFTENFNGQGMYWNYFYHVWKVFSASPYANSAVFVPGAPSITSVSVSPESVTVAAGQSVLLSATVVTANFASKAVNWSATISGEPVGPDDGVTISPLGVVTVGDDVTADTEIVVKATSVFDSTKYDTCTITVA